MAVRNFHIRFPKEAAVPDFIFDTLSIQSWEQCDSDNHEEGHYYRGNAHALNVEVTHAEYEGFVDYPYLFSVQVEKASLLDIDNVARKAIADLLKAGFAVAQEAGGRPGEVDRLFYSLDDHSALVTYRDTVKVQDD